MKELFQHIWDLAFQYQDKRDDAGHAAITLDYAETLVALENGKEDIVIPAIILHDIGWSQLSKQTIFFVLFNKDSTREEKFSIRLQHQQEGVKLAKGILTSIEYPLHMTEDILEIISEHDTREGFISKNEGLVRDADKLWRFSKTGFEADVRRSGNPSDSQLEILENELKKPEYLFSESAKRIALKELKLRKSKI